MADTLQLPRYYLVTVVEGFDCAQTLLPPTILTAEQRGLLAAGGVHVAWDGPVLRSLETLIRDHPMAKPLQKQCPFVILGSIVVLYP